MAGGKKDAVSKTECGARMKTAGEAASLVTKLPDKAVALAGEGWERATLWRRECVESVLQMCTQ